MELWVGTIIAAGALIGAITAAIIFVRRAWGAVVDVVQMQLAAGRIINAELVTNGGGTLLDKVNRIPAIETTIRLNIERNEAQAVRLEHEIFRNHAEALGHWRAIYDRLERLDGL